MGNIIENISDTFGTFGVIVIFVILVAWAILWFVLPFAVYAIKNNSQATNKELAELRREVVLLRQLAEGFAQEAQAADSAFDQTEGQKILNSGTHYP